MTNKEEEWGNVLCLRDGVVLRDRLMTDAALGGPRPIKSEHSYSLLASSPPPSPATPGANPHTPNSGSSSGAVGSTTANTSSSVDSVNLNHKSLDIRSRIDGKILLRLSLFKSLKPWKWFSLTDVKQLEFFFVFIQQSERSLRVFFLIRKKKKYTDDTFCVSLTRNLTVILSEINILTIRYPRRNPSACIQ